MLAIRMQRTGRKGHAMFRVVVQDARRTPTSGKVVARIGSYDPHAKTVTLDKDKAAFYLEHGAQPSERVAVILKKEGVKLPDWVKLADKREGTVRNPNKRRSTRPDEPVAEASAEEAPAEAAETAKEPSETEQAAPAEETTATTPEEPAAEAEAPAEDAETSVEEKPAEPEAASEPEAEKPAEETAETPETESEASAAPNKK